MGNRAQLAQISQISSCGRDYHQAPPLSSAGQQRQRHSCKGCIRRGLPTWTPPSCACSCVRLAENRVPVGPTLLQIEQQRGLEMFPFRSRALTSSDGWLVTSCAGRSHSVLSTLMRMLQNSSQHPPPCTALGVPCSLSQTPSSFGHAAGQFLSPAWTPPPPTSLEGGRSLVPSSTPPAPSLSLPWALRHLQSHSPPLQLGSSG